MFALDSKSLHRIAPTVSRVVIADPNVAAAKLLADLIKGIGGREVVIEGDEDRAYQAVHDVEPGLVFTERSGPSLNGETFARRIRKSTLICRRVPIVMVTAEATASTIKGARDVGIHEFLRKPFTSTDLFRRIENLALKPRDWIEGVAYIGPDRRRFNSGEYTGPKKRKQDQAVASPAAIKDQALRILASALAQFDMDPTQAVRSITIQVETLKALALRTSDTTLAVAVSAVGERLAMGQATRLSLSQPIQAVLALADPAPQPVARAG
ncbi:response regulator [Brevundimonas sp.]|uniref:response regulator n=2 Tax=Brevundimonas sp. TaxID=1871086 RepID=UPI00403338AA